MIEAATELALQMLMRGLSRSLLHYVSEAYPFTTDKDQALVPILSRQLREDQDAAARIGRLLLQERHRLPALGTYPMSFTTINFTSLTYLLPYLIDEDERFVADVERTLRSLPEHVHANVRPLLHEILELKRRHVQELRGLVAGH
jgi:hypothetical protein